MLAAVAKAVPEHAPVDQRFAGASFDGSAQAVEALGE